MVKRIERDDGIVEYYNENGQLHREDGPAIIKPSGTKGWFKNGELHREDGPAIICSDGTKDWYKNGKLHRDDGPAIIEPDGTVEWWLDDEKFSLYEWIKLVNITDEEKMELILYYG